MNTPLRAFSRTVIEPFVAVYESAFPVKNEITWLDRQALHRKHAPEAHLANPDNPLEKEMIGVVSHIAERMNIVVPKIIIYQSDKSNAMHLNNNTLAISSTKLAEYQTGSPELFAATIAHELTHQQQNAMSNAISIGRVLLDVGAGIAAGYATAQHQKQHGIAGTFIAGAVAAVASIATHLISNPLYAIFRREQEYAADENAAHIAGAENMIAVLEQKEEKHPRSVSWTKKITSKHPSHQERIDSLKEVDNTTQGLGR